MEAGIRVRPATQLDHLELVELWLALGAAGHEADPRYRLRADVRPDAFAFVADKWLGRHATHRVWVAEDAGGRITGYVAVRPADPHHVVDQDPTLLVTDLFVAHGDRRRVVGSALVRQVQAHARAQARTIVEVGTLAHDERALSFWRAQGFGDWRLTLRSDDP